MLHRMDDKEGEDRVSLRSDFTDAVRCVPPPAWVEHDPWPSEERQSGGALAGCEAWTDSGLLRVLYDNQVSLLQQGVAWHVRFLQRILTRAGAERAAHVAIEFNPAHDRLEVHFIRVWRGEQCIEHARPEDFQILRRETQLERLALDGRLTATLLIPDLRVDDRLETSFTLHSENRTLSGRHAAWVVFNCYAPWIETRHRLIHPVQRPVYSKAFNEPPQTRVVTGDRAEELTWRLHGQERITAEELVPPWSLQYPCYQVTEFQHWSEVAALFEKYYRDVVLPPDLVTELDGLAAEHTDEAARAVAWLRKVQTQLRYFALSLGEGGLVPRPINQIWAKRFGDCKDAARLYVAGARYLGLDACAALVSTNSGQKLTDYLPSPQLFNHAVVRLRLGEATYWLDPTMQLQGGKLEQMGLSYTGWGLPLTADTTELEHLPAVQPVQHIRCEDSFRFGSHVDSVAVLNRRIDFGYWTANSLRNRLEGEGTSKLSAQLLQELRRTWPDVVEKAAIQVQDDLEGNRFTLLCSYEVRNCWKRDANGRVGFEIVDPFIGNELAPLKDLRRTGEIFLGRPRKVTWLARLQMPCDWGGSGWSQALDEAGVHFKSELTINGQEVVIDREVQINAWSAVPGQAQAYAQIVEKVRQTVVGLKAQAGFEGAVRPIGLAQSNSAAQRQSRWHSGWLGLLFLPALIGGLNALHSSQHVDTVVSPAPFLPEPEAHVSSFDRVVDTPLENCILKGRDSVAGFLQNNCRVPAQIKILRPSGTLPYEVTIEPGNKQYIYFMQAGDIEGSLAACPSGDQIVDTLSGMPWAGRGTLYMCQHPLRNEH